MLRFMKKIGVSYLFSGLISIVIGVVFIIWPKLSQDVFCFIVGCAAVVFGLALFIYYLASSKKKDYLMNEMIIGLLTVVVGFLFIFKAETLYNLLGMLLGVFVVFHGLINIQESFVIKRCGNKKWYIFFLLSLLFVAAGLVILFVPGLDETVFAYILGLSLAFAGIFETVIFFILRKYVKRIEDGSEELTVITDGENGIIIKE